MNMYPYFNPYGGMVQPYQSQPAQPTSQVVKVNGENGARAYQLGANSSALLLDESGLLVWLVMSDGAGYKTVTAYDITPHEAIPAPDFGSLENRIKRLEEIVNGTSRNTANVSKKQSNDSIRKADDWNGKQRTESTGRYEPNDYEQSADETGRGLYQPERR